MKKKEKQPLFTIIFECDLGCRDQAAALLVFFFYQKDS